MPQLGTATEPGEREWRIRSLPRGYSGTYRVGDRFLKLEDASGVARISSISDADFADLILDLGDHLKLVRDTRSNRPFLEVVR